MSTENAAVTAGEDAVEDINENEPLPVTFSITSYGADYPIDGLVKRLDAGDIVIPRFSADEPTGADGSVAFQREFVWSKAQADRFIESLLLGLPVPGIFLVKEANGTFLVLDGQQRLITLRSFYKGLFGGREFKLGVVQTRWRDKTYQTLDAEDRRRLDNSILHATIVRQDEPSEDQSSIYMIFERLNSGGTALQPQEIRVALYHGDLAALLNELNADTSWRELYGRKSMKLKDIEQILRFFALNFQGATYERPMKGFLNKYMALNQDLKKQSAAILKPLFRDTIAAIAKGIGPRAFRPFGSAVNAAVLDSVMIGVADRLAKGPIKDQAQLSMAYDALMKDERYLAAVQRATADEDSVRARLELSRQAFSQVK
jgi:hypothetical protein